MKQSFPVITATREFPIVTLRMNAQSMVLNNVTTTSGDCFE